MNKDKLYKTRTGRSRVQRDVVREGRNAAALELLGIVVADGLGGEQHEKDVRVGLAVRRDDGNAHDSLGGEVLQTVHVDGEVGAAAGADVVHVLELRPEHCAGQFVGHVGRTQVHPVVLVDLAHHEVISNDKPEERRSVINWSATSY